MIAVDFFCGAGGLTRGLLNADINVVLGVDADARCRESYENNNHPARFLTADIRELEFDRVREIIGNTPQSELLLAGCSPCQPFSKQRKSDSKTVVDGTLLGRFAQFVEEFQPDQVFIENVPGIVKVPGFSTYRRFLNLLDDYGYSYTGGTVDAKYYGVPQTRRRFVLVAMRGVDASLPERTHGTKLQPTATVKEAIRHFPRIRAGQEHQDLPNHVAAAVSELNMERLRHTPKNGGDRRSWPETLCLDCHKKDYNGHSDVYGRMWWNRPAPALTGRCHSLSNGRYGHPSQNRAISLREAAALQSFDDDYVFYGSNKHIALQIGNAVPVKLAEAIARHILSLREAA